MSGRIIAIGDIHGCDVAFEAVLRMLDLGSDDTMVILGDVVDRGPDSNRVAELILELPCEVVFIMGNHEQMMLDALETGVPQSMWMMHGGRETLQSYDGLTERIPQSHLDLFSTGLSYWETSDEIFVHANLDPDLPLAEQTVRSLRWKHLTGRERPHSSGKRIICGHTPQRNGLPLVADGWVCIDTFAFGGAFLTALDVETNEIWQASQTGESRKGVRLQDLS